MTAGDWSCRTQPSHHFFKTASQIHVSDSLKETHPKLCNNFELFMQEDMFYINFNYLNQLLVLDS